MDNSGTELKSHVKDVSLRGDHFESFKDCGKIEKNPTLYNTTHTSNKSVQQNSDEEFVEDSVFSVIEHKHRFNMSSFYNEVNQDEFEIENSDDDDTQRLFSANGKEIHNSKSRFRRTVETIASHIKKTGLRLLMLVVLNGLYLYLGGVVFYLLERTDKQEEHIKRHIEKFINTLKASYSSQIPISNVTNFIEHLKPEEMGNLTQVFRDIHDEMSKKNQAEWTIASSVFFAATVVTTIGYGNLAPSTAGGRIFCVFYAIIGIPITLILLTLVGNILSKYINELCGVFIKAIRITFYPSYEYESPEGDTDLKAPVWLAVSFIMIFISLDALIYVYVEDWSFPVALYFLFISLTTIGFGDLVPQKTSIVWFNVTFLYIGLAAVSITINLLIANINKQYKKHKEKIKFVKKLEQELDSDDENTPLNEDCNQNTKPMKPMNTCP